MMQSTTFFVSRNVSSDTRKRHYFLTVGYFGSHVQPVIKGPTYFNITCCPYRLGLIRGHALTSRMG